MEGLRKPRPNRTPLQRHCDFFDRNGDDIMTPWDTYIGFRELGFNMLMAAFGTLLVHVFMSYVTQDSWVPDPFLSINLKNIHRAKHGSDSHVYDPDGHLNENNLSQLKQYTMNILSRSSSSSNSKSNKSSEFKLQQEKDEKEYYLTFWQGWKLTERNRDAWDVIGWWANKIEWFYVYALCADHGRVSWKDILGIYDGTLFYDLYERRMAQLEQ